LNAISPPRRASIDGFEHRGTHLSIRTDLATKWGIFNRHFWGDFSGIDSSDLIESCRRSSGPPLLMPE